MNSFTPKKSTVIILLMMFKMYKLCNSSAKQRIDNAIYLYLEYINILHSKL